MTSVQPDLRTQSIGDADIEYLAYGREGPYVVMLHATGFLPWLWHPVARVLAQHYRIIVPSFYNHRVADPHNGGLGWRQLAEDLKRLCDALGLDNAYFVGHSMGAAVATLAHAVQGVSAIKMALIEPIFLPQEAYRLLLSVDQHPLAAKAIKRRNQWRDREEARRDFRSKPFFQSWDKEVLELYIEHGLTGTKNDGLCLTCSPQQEAALFMGSIQFDPWPHLSKVVCPTVVVEGEISENRPWIDLKKVARRIPRGRYTEVAGAGHLIPMEKPAETAALIQTFFG